MRLRSELYGVLSECCFLNAKTYGDPDYPGIEGVLLQFEGKEVSVYVNPDDDTLKWEFKDIFPQYDGQVEKKSDFWERYKGRYICFLWEMKNQTADLDELPDALQIQFGYRDNDPVNADHHIVQMIGMASRLALFSLKQHHFPPFYAPYFPLEDKSQL